MTFPTTDISDQFGDQAQVAAPLFQSYGRLKHFSGAIATLKVFEDNSLVRTTLETPGQGRVLVVDGGGSLRCALVGGQLGELAVANGWSGVVVWGCVRDAAELNNQPLGIRAINTHPKKSVKKGEGSAGVVVHFADVTFTPGHYLYADEDGMVVLAEAITA